MKWSGTVARRGFLARFASALGLAGAASSIEVEAKAQTSGESAQWKPMRHPQDDWYEKIPGVHRFAFDTRTPDGLSQALGFAGTFMDTNKSGYEQADGDTAVIVIVRNRSVRFGFNDAMWAKYSAQFTQNLGGPNGTETFVDPKTKEAAIVNIHTTKGGQMDRLIQRGVQIAVCQVATRGTAGSLSRALGGKTDDYFKELSENLVPNARLVPSGILAVNRAQEHGYAIYAGG